MYRAMAAEAEAEAAEEARSKVYIEQWKLKQKQIERLELRYINIYGKLKQKQLKVAKAKVYIVLWQLK